MRNQIVILAAGKGTRMGQAQALSGGAFGQAGMPKVLVMLKNKPLIFHLLEQVDKINQLAKPLVVVGYKHMQVRSILGDGYMYALQERQMGTGHALMCAEGAVQGDNILVLYGDMPFIKAESLRKLMRLHHSKKSNISMFISSVNNFAEFPSLHYFGRIIRDVYGNILKITEYKDATAEEKNIREVNPGIYMFNSTWLFNNIHKIQNKNAQGEYYLTDMVEVSMAMGESICSLAISPREILGVNSPEELLAAEKMA